MDPKRVIIVISHLPLEKPNPTKLFHTKASFDHAYGSVVFAAHYLEQNKIAFVNWVGGWEDQGPEMNQRFKTEMGPNFSPVFFKEELLENFSDFCMSVLWPLLHYQQIQGSFNVQQWKNYVQVNETLAEEVARIYQKNDLIFVQDFHLMLLPRLVRQKLPESKIGFFLHTPFPTSELYRILAPRVELLRGLLGADLIGFHTWDYVRHFLSTVTRILGIECTHRGIPEWQDFEGSVPRSVFVTACPTGIDFQLFSESVKRSEVQAHINKLRNTFKGITLVVGRDVLDVTKGIPEKLLAFEQFLTQYPEWQGKIVLIQNCVKMFHRKSNSKDDAEDDPLQKTINEHVGRINGLFGNADYMPISYISTEISWEELCATYHLADVCMITSLRDGFNLVTHEYVACQVGKSVPGALILSEFAGACQSLCGAIRVNPWNVDQIVQALHQAVTMSPEERTTKHEYNLRYVSTHTALTWANTLLNNLLHSEFENETLGSIPEKLDFQVLKEEYQKSKNRIFLLDYDGTLSPIASKPHLAIPSDYLIKLLKKLASDERNIIYVISGRDRQSLDSFLGSLPIGLSAEHGCFIRHPPRGSSNNKLPGEWECIVAGWDNTWKDTIYSIFKDFQERTPGSMIERKQINITWHYRNSDPDYGSWMSKELLAHLRDSVSTKLPIEVLVGKKAIEVRPKGINKAAAVKKIFALHENISFDFILCIGDDKTDEDMFEGLHEVSKERTLTNIFTVTVGKKRSEAKYYLETQLQVLQVLSFLCDFDATSDDVITSSSTNNVIVKSSNFNNHLNTHN